MGRLLPMLVLGPLLFAAPALAEAQAKSEAGGAGSVVAESAAEKPGDEVAAERGAKTPAQRARSFRTRLLAGIELSAEQTRRIDEIERDHVRRQTDKLDEMNQLRSQMKRARREGDGERVLEYAEKLREARKADRRQTDWIHEMREVLNPDQQQQFDANRERIRQESKRRGL